MFKTLRIRVNSAIDSISRRFSVPKIVPIGVLGTAILAVPIGGYAMFSQNMETNTTQFWVDDEVGCRNYVKEAMASSKSTNKESESNYSSSFTIPEITSGSYKTGYVSGWSQTVADVDGNSEYKSICDFYSEHGGYLDKDGFEKIGNYYIVSIMLAPFDANIGDHMTFHFDDGTSIDAIVGDAKSCDSSLQDPEHFDDAPLPDPNSNGNSYLFSNGWGSIDKSTFKNDCQVLSFWGSGKRDISNSMVDLKAATGGSFERVISADNHGTAKGFIDGLLNEASRSQLRARQASSRGAIDECKANTPYDNSVLAKAAVSFAWSSNAGNCNDVPTDLYQEVIDATIGTDCQPDGKCCYCTVRSAIMWTGADIDFPQANYEVIDRYLEQSPLWERVPNAQNVHLSASEDDIEKYGIEPGDFAIVTPDCWKYGVRGTGVCAGHGHVAMYVSREIAQEVYDQFIVGRNGDSGYRPDTEYVQSSYKDFTATCLDYNDTDPVEGRYYNYWRYVGSYEDKDEYANVGTIANLRYTLLSGTKCDCEEECTPDVGEELAYLAVQCASWYDKGNGWDTDGVFAPAGSGDGAWPWYNPYTLDHSSTGEWVEEAELWTEAVSVDRGIYREVTRERADLIRNEAKVFNEVGKNATDGMNSALASCNQAVCVLAAAVVDMDMTPHRAASGNPGFMKYYLEHHPQTWRHISATSVEDLEPGDILVVANMTVPVSTGDDGLPNFDEAGETGWDGCHTALYVGKDLAGQRFPEIKSWSSKGVVYQAGYSHDHGRYPGLNPIDDIGMYTVFRPIRHNNNSKYEDVDYRACIPNWHLKSSCPDEDVINTGGYSEVVAKAREFLGRPYLGGRGRRPYSDRYDPNLEGADCSGLVVWAYYQALGVDISAQGGGNGTHEFESHRSGGCWQEVSRDELVPGDIIVCVCNIEADAMHTILYCGYNEAGVEYCIEEAPPDCHELSMTDALNWSKDPNRLYFLHYVG